MSNKQKRTPETIAIVAAVLVFSALMFMFLPVYSSNSSYNLIFGFSNVGSSIRTPIIPLTVAFVFVLVALILSLLHKLVFRWKWSLLTAGILCIVAAILFFCTQVFYGVSVNLGWNDNYPFSVEAGPIVVGVFLAIPGIGLVVWNILTAKGII
ncbi:MAG: hypothetical protein WC366_00360 [Bacilli bacterium]|jgi:glucan phosphoethanolaminetransferase (alkaline phosphatase superfamily)